MAEKAGKRNERFLKKLRYGSPKGQAFALL